MFSNIDVTVNQYTYEEFVTTTVFNHIKKIRENKKDVTDIITSTKKYLTYEHSLVEISQLVCKQINKSRNATAVITGLNETLIVQDVNSNLLVVIYTSSRNVCATDKLKSDVQISFVGTIDQITNLIEFFDEKFRNSSARINWYFVSRGDVDSVGLYLPDVLPIYSEYYPWLHEGPKAYFQKYLNSKAPILFISGDPGTGKTSFLRAMINEYNLNTYVGYDEKLFTTDLMFIEFLTSDADILILEDSEALVYPRKSENNTLISRLLNVSDGLLKLPRKKIVFTTNEAGFINVDDALLRPGRCFDSKEFRLLTFEEAKLAAVKAGVEVPTEDKEYSLANLFNSEQKVRKNKVGF